MMGQQERTESLFSKLRSNSRRRARLIDSFRITLRCTAPNSCAPQSLQPRAKRSG
jgi:hypothetical protein